MEAKVRRCRQQLVELKYKPEMVEWHAEAYRRGLKMEKEAHRPEDQPQPSPPGTKPPCNAPALDGPPLRHYAPNDLYHRNLAVKPHPQVSTAPRAHHRPYAYRTYAPMEY